MYLLVVLLEEVEFLLQTVQVSSQGGDDLLVVGLGLFQSDAVPLHRLTHDQLRLPPRPRRGQEHGTVSLNSRFIYYCKKKVLCTYTL